MIESIAETVLGLAQRLLGPAAVGDLILQARVGGLQLLGSLAYAGFEPRLVVPEGLKSMVKFRRVLLDLTGHGVERLSHFGDLGDSRFTRPV